MPEGDDGIVRVDRATFNEARSKLARLEREAEQRQVAEGDAVLAQAAREGRITRAQAKGAFAKAMGADPEGTVAMLQRRPPNSAAPVAEIGTTGQGGHSAVGGDAAQRAYHESYFPSLRG